MACMGRAPATRTWCLLLLYDFVFPCLVSVFLKGSGKAGEESGKIFPGLERSIRIRLQ